MAVELDAVVAELVARSGAQAARLVDARTGSVLSSAGTVAGDEVSTLVRMARDAAPMAVAGGGMEDLVLATRDAVHVLRTVTGGFLHLRIRPEQNVEVARRALASPALRRALERVLAPAPVLPRPRVSADAPALAALGAPAPMAGAGALAVLALGRLPRREASRPAAAPTVLNQNWALDVDTMQRLVAGLHRLN